MGFYFTTGKPTKHILKNSLIEALQQDPKAMAVNIDAEADKRVNAFYDQTSRQLNPVGLGFAIVILLIFLLGGLYASQNNIQPWAGGLWTFFQVLVGAVFASLGVEYAAGGDK